MAGWNALMVLQELENAEIANNRDPRQFLVRNSAFELCEEKFKKLFRLPKVQAQRLIADLEEFLPQQKRRSAIDATTAVLTTLRFMASGSYQTGIGQEVNLAVSQATVSRTISAVVSAINNNLYNEWVRFPLNNLGPIKQRFFEEYGFPGVIGAIDCTHVAIIAPTDNDPMHPEHIYVNRKHYHSINVQLVCDADMRILSVNANFPGSTNDAYIWRSSNLKAALQQNHQDNISSWLLGDSGYPLEPWLMTPLPETLNRGEERYNEVQAKARSVIERCNGLLKSRWRCLLKHRALHYQPEKASQMITAATVLHNMCIEHNVHLPPQEFIHDEVDDDVNVQPQVPVQWLPNPILANARRLQRRLIQHEFL